jgi:putative acetyltransferase
VSTLDVPGRRSVEKNLDAARRSARATVSHAKIFLLVLMTHGESVVIRCEDAEDQFAIRTVNESAFGRLDEADLVDRLRKEGAVILSLVAETKKQIVGHILFSRMWIDDPGSSIAAVALAPMAVLPAHQRKGIGAALIRGGLDSLRDRGERIVLVLGHPDYYPRFGFSAEKAHGLVSPFPSDAFMAAELGINAPGGICGKVRYPVAFNL